MEGTRQSASRGAKHLLPAATLDVRDCSEAKLQRIRPGRAFTSTMPLHIAGSALFGGIDQVPYLSTGLKIAACIGLLYLLKAYFAGRSNTSERNMHGKVVMVTVQEPVFAQRMLG